MRVSCLAALATVASTLRLALHPWAVDVLALAESALEPHRAYSDTPPGPFCGEQVEASILHVTATALRDERRAAAYLVGLLLQRLGADAATVLSSKQLRNILVRLRATRDITSDDVLRAHALAAIAEMDTLGRSMLRAADGPAGLMLRMP